VRQTIVLNFEREANLLATLSHPSIPRIYDYFTEEDRSYLVLEFIGGPGAIITDTTGFCPMTRCSHGPSNFAMCSPFCTATSGSDHLSGHEASNVSRHGRGREVVDQIARPSRSGNGTMIARRATTGECVASHPCRPVCAGCDDPPRADAAHPRLEPPFSFAERPLLNCVSAELGRSPPPSHTVGGPLPGNAYEAIIGWRNDSALSKRPARQSSAAIKPIWSFKR
jgi:hypothetical protein